MNAAFTFLLTILFLLTACNTSERNGKDTTGTVAGAGSQKPKTVRDVEPSLLNADSLQVIYYDDPDGDSLRYSRYFTYMETADTALIRSLSREIDQVYVQQAYTRPCRSEGKLYFMKGDAMVKTIYFSARKDSCAYFYFIKDGSFFYLPLSAGASNVLKKVKSQARKPKAAG